ncbi:hypothetical protein EVAR_12597_1 [Eumeta japonica]|uniref:Uncharacterized protein n=1 Tax=Eumeta variegata TaxID=151549 RepID=A0A4C1UFK9_EUMVA|nr:hypothetical protein EVAR_12597_1 [Eumeta japonica]
MSRATTGQRLRASAFGQKSTWLLCDKGRPLRYHTLTEFRREVAAFVVAFRKVSENSGGPLIFHHSAPFPSIHPPSDIQFLPKRLLSPLWMRVSIDGDDQRRP